MKTCIQKIVKVLFTKIAPSTFNVYAIEGCFEHESQTIIKIFLDEQQATNYFEAIEKHQRLKPSVFLEPVEFYNAKYYEFKLAKPFDYEDCYHYYNLITLSVDNT
jgi:hypothetical protein